MAVVPQLRQAAVMRRAVAACRQAAGPLLSLFGRRAEPAAVLPDRLDGFTGPSEGVVVLPVRLFWSGNSRFDLADTDEVAAAYGPIFLNGSPADLVELVNGERLEEAWPKVCIPWSTRKMMETRYPQLRQRRLAAAA